MIQREVLLSQEILYTHGGSCALGVMGLFGGGVGVGKFEINLTVILDMVIGKPEFVVVF